MMLVTIVAWMCLITIDVAHALRAPRSHAHLSQRSKLQGFPKRFEYDPVVGVHVYPRRFKKSTKQLATIGA